MRTIWTITFVLLWLASCQQKTGNEASSQSNSFTFAFLTDIHVQPELKADDGFIQAIGKVNELEPDFVITGGDLIMDALGVSYDRADLLYTMYNELIGSFDMPVYNTMGNHEVFGLYPESGVDSTHAEYGKQMYEKRIGKRYYSFDHKGWHFIILDAIGIHPERTYYGYIDEEQVEWLADDLQTITRETPIVIVVHIPFFTSMTQLSKGSLEANNEGIVITNARDVLIPLYDYNLKLVLQGHLHFLEDIYVGGKTHFLTGGAVSANWWKGPRGNMEEGFVLIKVSDNEIDWEYVDYGWEAVQGTASMN